MNNTTVESFIMDCIDEISDIKNIINKAGSLSPTAKYLTGYTLILTCGTLEYSFKNIISDFHNSASQQIQDYITQKVRNSSQNPNLENMSSLLKDFDKQWNIDFKNQIKAHKNTDKIKISLSSINNNRNEFAHGKKRTFSFNDIVQQFYDSLEFILIMDSIVK